MNEQREILRRIAERGLGLAQRGSSDYPDRGSSNAAHKQHLDLWQHLLDEIERLPSGDNSND